MQIRGAHTFAAIPGDVNGSFHTVLAADEETLSTTFFAKGYFTRNRTLVVHNGVADAGTIRLQQTISADTLTITNAADEKASYLDVFVKNESDVSVTITSVSLQAAVRLHTDCLDGRPALQFAIGQSLRAGKINTDVSDQMPLPPDAIMARGQFLELPCKQRRLDIEIPYSFKLESKEHRKIRIVVPSVLQLRDPDKLVQVPLGEYASVAVVFRTSDGGDAHASRQLPEKSN